jgi:hypothetical protein
MCVNNLIQGDRYQIYAWLHMGIYYPVILATISCMVTLNTLSKGQ